MSAAYISVMAILFIVARSNSQAKSAVSDEIQSCKAPVEELEDEVAHFATTYLLQNSLHKMRAEPKQPHGNSSTPLLFVHIPKNAGCTIEETGRSNGIAWGCDMFPKPPLPSAFQTMPDGSKCSLMHTPPSLITLSPNPYDGAEVFCIARDPFQRAVSEYLWVRTHKANFGCPQPHADPFHSQVVTQVPGCDTLPACSAEGLNFFLQEILNSVVDGQQYINDCHMVPQSQYIWGHDNSKTWCQDILRLEQLDTDFAELMEVSGLDLELVKESNVAVENCDNITTEALSEESKRLIRLVYKDDFERLHYNSMS